MPKLLSHFNRPWAEVPTIWIDTETTGVLPGHDRAVQVAIARFEGGVLVDGHQSLVDPGIPIPPEATKIHGITDDQVVGQITVEEFFREPRTIALLQDAQPAAYNAPFDRHFVPPFGDDWTWPWLDALSLVRVIDRYVKGTGRHKLDVTAARHGIPAWDAHEAAGDAAGAGKLFYVIASKAVAEVRGRKVQTLGDLLHWQRIAEGEEWFRFNAWLSTQPPREVQP